jgi:periodic tryptophan protein 1
MRTAFVLTACAQAELEMLARQEASAGAGGTIEEEMPEDLEDDDNEEEDEAEAEEKDSDAAMEADEDEAESAKQKQKKDKKGKSKKQPEREADPAELDVETKMLEELNMDAYDESDEGEEADPVKLLGGRALTMYESNEDDPLVTLPDEEDVSDDEDAVVLPTDAVIVTGRTEDEESVLEVQIFEEATSTIYVHHDVALPAFPLCMTWLNRGPQLPAAMDGMDAAAAAAAAAPAVGAGSFLAVGTFQPEIEIWNLDVMDALEPVATLGGREAPAAPSAADKKSKKKKGKALKEKLLGKLKEGSHADAVMCMSWHEAHPTRLASGSADMTVKLWDVSTQQCTATFKHHTNKVQVGVLSRRSLRVRARVSLLPALSFSSAHSLSSGTLRSPACC